MIREDAGDLIFPTAEGKWQAVIDNVIQRSDSGPTGPGGHHLH